MSTTMVLKFGGSSLADNSKLELVAKRIAKIYDKNKRIVVVLSAQGKTTDRLLSEAKELAPNVYPREMATLLTTGEQISIAKLSILLNYMGYPAISLTGWQAGIYTDMNNEESHIKYIDTSRINEELNKEKIVIVAGFQGINENMDITTLGRGGSDTTAVAIASALNTNKCYIFSDVDGVYTADPNIINETKKIPTLSYKEMIELSNEGAKVLHNRSVNIAEDFNVSIIAKSTFKEDTGTNISNKIENTDIKSLIKKDISRISVIGNEIINNNILIQDIIEFVKTNNLKLLNIEISEIKLTLTFKEKVTDDFVNKLHELIFKNSSK